MAAVRKQLLTNMRTIGIVNIWIEDHNLETVRNSETISRIFNLIEICSVGIYGRIIWINFSTIIYIISPTIFTVKLFS
jgi:hypothetical protein